MKQIILADDSKLLCDLLQEKFSNLDDLSICCVVDNVDTLKNKLPCPDADMIVLDYSLPVHGGSEIISWLRKNHPELLVVVFSVYSDETTAGRALGAGAHGFISKNSEFNQVVRTIRDVAAGQTGICCGVELCSNTNAPQLTGREKEILTLLAGGLSNRLIAEKLFISLKTVEAHRANMREKLGVNSTASLIKFAIREGLIPPSD